MSYRDELEAARARIRVLEDQVDDLRAKLPLVSVEQLRDGHDRALARIRSLELDIARLLAVLVEVSGRAAASEPEVDASSELGRIRELARRAIVGYVDASSAGG